MQSQQSREVFYYKLPVFVADLCIHIIVLLCLLTGLSQETVSGFVDLSGGLGSRESMGLFVLLSLSFSLSIAHYGLILHERRIRLWVVVMRAVKQTLLTSVFFTGVLAMIYKDVPRIVVLSEFAYSLPLIVVCHWLSTKIVRQIRKSGRNIRRAVIVGADVTAQRTYNELLLGHSFSGYQVEGFFSSLPDVQLPEGAKFLGTVEEFWDWIEQHNPDELYCSLPPATCSNEVNRIIQLCNERFIDFYFVPTFDGYPKRHMQVQRLGNVNIIKLREEPMNTPIAKLKKRGFDLVASGLFLCTVYPFVLLFVWIGNKVTGNVGPLYFKQARTGYNGKSFMIYKFRSMKVNADADKLQATKDDPRKTPFGDFLRRSSIDELPQFINVWKGDMSIIGPRPHMEYHTEMYSALIDNYMVRHLAKPGITGWAQVSGCRGETKTVEEMANRVEHDIWYIEHWSGWLDATIFLKTIWQVMPGHDKQAY